MLAIFDHAPGQHGGGGFHGQIAAVAHFDDQIAPPVHAAFNFYREAGLGFADLGSVARGRQKQEPGIEKL